MGKLKGRPRLYNTPEEMQKLIDQYFADCEGELALDDAGNPILTKFGYVYKKPPKPPTSTGLALALGFNSRQTLINYENYLDDDGNNLFLDTIKRARLRLENYNETMAYDRDAYKGAALNLASNYGWQMNPSIQITNNTLNLEVNDDEIDKRLTKSYMELQNSSIQKKENG